METFLIVLLILIVIVIFFFIFLFIFNSKKDHLENFENYLNNYPRRSEIPDIVFNGDVDTTWENWDSKPEVLSSMANFLNQSFEYYLFSHDVASFTNMETVITKYLATAPLNPKGKVPWGEAIDELYFSYIMCKPLANFATLTSNDTIATFILNYIKYPNQSFITEVSGVYIYSLGIPWAIANYILNGIVNTSLITQGIQKEMNYENLDGTKVLYDGGYLVRDKVVDYESLINLQQDIKLLQTLGFRIHNNNIDIDGPLRKILDSTNPNTTGTFSSSRFTSNTTSTLSQKGIDVIPSIGFIRYYNEDMVFSCRGSKMYIAALERSKLMDKSSPSSTLEFYYSHREAIKTTLNYRYATVISFLTINLKGFKTSNFFDEASSVCGMLNGEGILINKYSQYDFVVVEEILCLSTINKSIYHMITMKSLKRDYIYYVTEVDNAIVIDQEKCWVTPFYGDVSNLTFVVYPLDNNVGYFICSDSSSKVPRVAMYNIPPASLKYTTKINNVEYTTTFDGKQFVFDEEKDFTGDLTPLPSIPQSC